MNIRKEIKIATQHDIEEIKVGKLVSQDFHFAVADKFLYHIHSQFDKYTFRDEIRNKLHII